LLFLPPYSPDFNSIEESFSAGKGMNLAQESISDLAIMKAWIRRHWRRMQSSETPELDLLKARGAVTAESARGWFQHSGF
ncbi:hypothetical protein B0H16DRAFT_1217561, partial [Mycena metata]